MAHFATINESNVVTQVDVINNDVMTDNEGVEREQLGIDFMTELYGAGTYKQTSYNHNFRKNYAHIGGTYDAARDAFIEPQPFPSWVLDEATCKWKSPIARPADEGVDGKWYKWDEDAHQADNATGWVVVANEHLDVNYPDFNNPILA